MVLIREFATGDIPRVEACFAELQDFSRLIYSRMADGTVARDYLRYLLARCQEWQGQIFVAEVGGAIAGAMCVFGAIPAREPDEIAYEFAYVSDLVVMPEFRGQGLGRLLLKHAEEYARSRKANLLRINVLARNRVARELYLDCGFDEHLIVLHKSLSGE